MGVYKQVITTDSGGPCLTSSKLSLALLLGLSSTSSSLTLPLSYVLPFDPPLTPTIHTPFQLYSSADAVVILNAASLQLIRVLAFQEVFPGLQSLGEHVSCIAADPAMKIVRQLVAMSFPRNAMITSLRCRSWPP